MQLFNQTKSENNLIHIKDDNNNIEKGLRPSKIKDGKIKKYKNIKKQFKH